MKILVTRFSAFGDVILSIPVILNLLDNYPDLEIIYVTKKFNAQLFQNIERTKIVIPDFAEKHKGILGLRRLAKELVKEYKPDFFADIHNVLRTKILRFFLLGKLKTSSINKGRSEKKALTKKANGKQITILKHTTERYADVFRQMGFNIDLTDCKIKFPIKHSDNVDKFVQNNDFIIVAPFAAHLSKMYPLNSTEILLKLIVKKKTIIILGGGKKEKEMAEKWQNEINNVHSAIGKFNVQEEIYLMSKAQAVLTMDSANMHLAALTNTKLFSIWGPTHPNLGFSPLNYKNNIYIQKELFCRPCSVYGNKECYRNSYECFDISPLQIAETILNN